MSRAAHIMIALLFAGMALATDDHSDRMPNADLLLAVSYNRGDASDRSPMAITGTTVGGTTFSGRAMACDGAGDGSGHGSTVLIPEATAAPFSLSVWIRPTAIEASGFSAICGLRTSASATMQFWLSNAAGYQDLSWGTPTWGEIRATLSTFLNRWNHIVITYDGVSKQATSSWKLYQDGVSKTLAVSSFFGAYNVDNGIGKFRTADDTGDFIGTIDDFRLFNRQLSATEAEALYADGLGNVRSP